MSAGGNMHDLSGWEPITCAESDTLRPDLAPLSSLTDPTGDYGAPVIYTEWGTDDGPVLRDYRWPGAETVCAHPETVCAHYVLGLRYEART